MSLQPSPWLMRQRGGERRLRLFCFSYAGGSATHYLPWQAALDPAIEICAVQLPGRGPRMAETPLASLPLLVDKLGDVIAQQNDLPFAFFGHSLGGLTAFELARHCRRHHLPMPEHLFVSACNAPQGRPPPRRLHELDDDGLIAALKDYNGTPPSALADREFMELMLPAIRADFALVADYQYRDGPLLDVPITVLAGKYDKHVLSERLCRWREETTESCELRWFEGDHFFIHAQRDAVLACVARELAALMEIAA